MLTCLWRRRRAKTKVCQVRSEALSSPVTVLLTVSSSCCDVLCLQRATLHRSSAVWGLESTAADQMSRLSKLLSGDFVLMTHRAQQFLFCLRLVFCAAFAHVRASLCSLSCLSRVLVQPWKARVLSSVQLADLKIWRHYVLFVSLCDWGWLCACRQFLSNSLDERPSQYTLTHSILYTPHSSHLSPPPLSLHPFNRAIACSLIFSRCQVPPFLFFFFPALFPLF